MDNIDDLKSEKTAKRIIHKVHFDFSAAEVSYTDASQGGAASGMNDALLLKAKQPVEEDLTDDQRAILVTIGEEFTPLLKSSDNPSPSSVESDTGEDNQLSKGKDEPMTDTKNDERVALLEKKLAISETKQAFAKYDLDADAGEALIKAVATLDGDVATAVVVAMDALLDKAKVAHDAELEKAVADADTTTDLQKSLAYSGDVELGEGALADEPLEKTLAQEANELLDAEKTKV